MTATTRRSPDLRDTPRVDRSAVGMKWTDQWRYQALDLFCGRGGVGFTLADHPAPLDPHVHAGVDYEDYSDTYPGTFAQVDLLDPIPSPRDLAAALDAPDHQGYRSLYTDGFDDQYGPPSATGVTADVVWVSFPCTAYSSLSATHYGSREAALEANPRLTEAFREFVYDLGAHVIIENVPGATRAGDLHANCRLNGLAFGQPYNLERHFETTFPVPDAYVPPAGKDYITVDTRDDQSIQALADAKGVPADWGKQGVRSAIPGCFVRWLLHHCPAIPSPRPERVNSLLTSEAQNLLGVDTEPP